MNLRNTNTVFIFKPKVMSQMHYPHLLIHIDIVSIL